MSNALAMMQRFRKCRVSWYKERGAWRLEAALDVGCLMVGLNWEAGPLFYGIYLHLGPLIVGAFKTGGTGYQPTTNEDGSGICETTLTPRLPRSMCKGCGTYEGNLGPCTTWLEGAEQGRCAYCDHKLVCHPETP